MLTFCIDFDPVRKRYIRAVKNFRPGEIILREEAYEAVVHNDQCGVYCHQSFRSSGNRLR